MNRSVRALTVAACTFLLAGAFAPGSGVFVSGAAATPQVAASGNIAFVDVTVVPMDAERLIGGQTVVVQGGVITQIGPADAVVVPAGVQTIDATGRYLMPGLVDSHVHANNAIDPKLYVANGITAVRNLWGGPAHLEVRSGAAESPEFTSPVVYTAGPLIDGEPPIWQTSAVAMTAAEGRALVNEHADAGYDFIKVYNRLPAEAYWAIVETARERGLSVAGHVPEAVGLYAVLEGGGQRAIEHFRGYPAAVLSQRFRSTDDANADFRARFNEIARDLETGALGWDEVYPPEELRRAARATVAHGVWNIPTVTVKQWVAHDEYEERASGPWTQYVMPGRLAGWNPASGRRADLSSDQLRANRALDRGFAYRMIAALHEAGAGLLVGTDTPNPFVLPGYSIHEELAHFVAAGLTPFETLERATRIPAEFMGTDATVGTVTVGKRADLLLLRDNPLQDVAHAQELEGVVLRGRWMPRQELDAMLAEIEQEVAAAAEEQRP